MTQRFQYLTFTKSGFFLIPYRDTALFIPDNCHVRVDHERRISTLEWNCTCGDSSTCGLVHSESSPSSDKVSSSAALGDTQGNDPNPKPRNAP
jgi:hypothetical protein